jgi:multidrug efflux pump subunit AcrA (membrane-fusion protein)
MKSLALTKIFVGVLAIAIIVYFVSQVIRSKNTTEDMHLGAVKTQKLLQRVTISGQIWPRKRFDIRPPFNAYIIKLYVKVGDHLKYHDPIITFSPSLSLGETNFPLRAGFDGVVTQVLRSEGEYVTEAGDQNLILRVEDLSELSVLGSVPELDIAKIKLGQEALIRVSSLVGETFTGHITEIGLSARNKDNSSSASSEFQIKVSMHLMTCVYFRECLW